MIHRRLAVVVCAVVSCTLVAPSIAGAQAPDVILVGGKVFTADPARPWAQAVATRGDRILKPGMLADLAVLSQDIFTVAPDALPATSSVLTMIGGRVLLDAISK